MTDAIKVAVRVRPLSKQEQENGHAFAWNVQGNVISPIDARDSRYTLDHVFGPNWTTRRIYEATTQPLLQKVTWRTPSKAAHAIIQGRGGPCRTSCVSVRPMCHIPSHLDPLVVPIRYVTFCAASPDNNAAMLLLWRCHLLHVHAPLLYRPAALSFSAGMGARAGHQRLQ